MSARKQTAVVVRTYNATPGACAQAVKLLLNSCKENAAGMTSTNGGDAKERSKDDSSARQIIQQ